LGGGAISVVEKEKKGKLPVDKRKRRRDIFVGQWGGTLSGGGGSEGTHLPKKG